jgi:ribosomal protein S14
MMTNECDSCGSKRGIMTNGHENYCTKHRCKVCYHALAFTDQICDDCKREAKETK